MNGRQEYALIHPLASGDDQSIIRHRTIERQPDGNLLVIILAVDR